MSPATSTTFRAGAAARGRALRRLAVLAVVLVATWAPITPASATVRGGEKCYISSGKPVPPQSGPISPAIPSPGEPIADCDQLHKYTKPSTLLGGDATSVHDARGLTLDAYYFDATPGYGTVDRVTHADVVFTTLAADWLFSLNKLLIWVACWLLGVAVKFGVADALTGPVAQAAQAYQDQVVDRFGLVNLCLVLCVFWFGLSALRGRVGKGAGEILLSFCLAALAGLVLAAPADTLLGEHGLLGGARDVGVSLAALPLDDPDAAGTGQLNPDTVIAPFQHAIIDTFVRQPHQQLAYGVVFDDAGAGAHPCLDTYDTILKTPEGDESPMYDLMAKCDPRLAENLRANVGTRLVGTLLVTIGSAIILAYVLIGVVLPLIGGQLALAALAVLAVLALPVSLLGGPGRRPLWLWVGSTVSVLATIVIAFGSLSFFLIAARALTVIQGSGFLMRLLLVDLAAVILLACHRRIGQSGQAHLRFAVRRLDRAKVGGSGLGGMGMGGRGWSLRGVWRDVRQLDAQAGHVYQRAQVYTSAFGRGFRRGLGHEDPAGDRSDPGPAAPAAPAVCRRCAGDGTISIYIESLDDVEERECPSCHGTGNP